MILPTTANLNDGYCMPCVQKRKRLEREKFIQENRRTVDLYAGITDPVEMIRILQTPRPLDPLIQYVSPARSLEDLYGSLDSAHANRLMRLSADALRNGQTDLAEGIGKSLAVLPDFSLDPMLEAWVVEKHFWPPVAYQKASSAIRDSLISAMDETSGTLRLDHALCALAWIGDKRVCEQFLQWESSTPQWQAELHVGPSRYAHVAGWEPTQGGRRNLFHETSLAIQPAGSESCANKAVSLLKDNAGACPWCGSVLVALVDMDLLAPEFAFLGISGPRLPFVTCEACTCFGMIFGSVDDYGIGHWSSHNTKPDWLPDDRSSLQRGPWSGVSVELVRRRAIHAVDWCMDLSMSQIGGLPAWVQDAEYPSCPACQRTMTFAAQLDNGHFSGYEGMYYAFLCLDCRVTATTYQQT